MKTKKFGIIAISFILTGSFFSCNNEDFADYNSQKLRLSKVLSYSNSSASKLTNEVVYMYDEAGNMVKESFYDCNSTATLERYNEYEYSENKKTKMKIFDGVAGNPTLGSYIEYFYTGDLLVKEETRRGQRGDYGSLVYSMHYEYDEKGNLTEEYMYDPSFIGKGEWGGVYDNGILGHKKYIYDNQNRLIITLTTDGVLDFYPCLKHIYDDNGRVIKTEYYEYEGLNGYVDIVYNGTSKLPEKELHYDQNGNQIRKYQHYYDHWGNLTETIINDECSMFKRKYNGKFLIEEIRYWWHEYGHFGMGQMPESGMSIYKYEEF